MTQFEQPTGILVFTSSASGDGDGDRHSKITPSDAAERDYFQAREQAERAAAERASSAAARSRHQELALGYSAKLRCPS
jgi:hypothetical protein